MSNFILPLDSVESMPESYTEDLKNFINQNGGDSALEFDKLKREKAEANAKFQETLDKSLQLEKQMELQNK